jgi:hypothetical protein
MKKFFWKLSLSLLLIGSACLYSLPVRADSSVTQQKQQLATTLQQLINTLTAELQQLEQQLAAEQTLSTSSTASSVQNASITTPQATSSKTSVAFSDCIVEATTTQPTLYNNQLSANVYFKTLTLDGAPIPNKHLYINGTFYSSDASGTITVGRTSYLTPSWQFTIKDEGLPTQSQMITITTTPYTVIPPLNYTDPCAAHYIGPAIKSSGPLMCA